MFALVLSEHADVHVNAAHAAKLLLVHDIVEIDAGDAPIHASGVSKSELEAAEHKAAERIFGLLPMEQAGLFRDMWLEFEAGRSPEARFAKGALRRQPPSTDSRRQKNLHSYRHGSVGAPAERAARKLTSRFDKAAWCARLA
jgi:5'-deoxynucleotidase YfbR-like HD superfamily hydrolase